jgi:serine/threonine-protein kinase
MLGASDVIARTAIQRFEREAQSTAELSSPHSVALYDFGVTDEGLFYYVMELLKGIDLRTAVEKFGPMPAERAIHVLQQCCHSLTDAHAIGVIHRDIKPANVLICRYGSDHDFVKILDFGLVKQLGDADTVGAQLTAEGIATGTPAFMAPEMALDNRNVDGRADLYALGCVGYWLLTGSLVFDGESPMAVVLKHAKDAPVPPSHRTELPIPADLEQIILACLEKDRDRRPQSAQELSLKLTACAGTLSPWTQERAVDWWQTHLPDLARGT